MIKSSSKGQLVKRFSIKSDRGLLINISRNFRFGRLLQLIGKPSIESQTSLKLVRVSHEKIQRGHIDPSSVNSCTFCSSTLCIHKVILPSST
ncbi:hypothetical protein ACJIZ3_023415 [Penstemon smallii]|uniref:Uncharacterized protein n=1 Tax=Penstemon smallii TaxID=265156 RepID=A0ABD3TP06_9LAMI